MNPLYPPPPVILIGESDVEKNNLLSRYSKKQFHRDSLTTIGVQFCTRTVQLDTSPSRPISGTRRT